MLLVIRDDGGRQLDTFIGCAEKLCTIEYNQDAMINASTSLRINFVKKRHPW
jgi:hypothetical protein